MGLVERISADDFRRLSERAQETFSEFVEECDFRPTRVVKTRARRGGFEAMLATAFLDGRYAEERYWMVAKDVAGSLGLIVSKDSEVRGSVEVPLTPAIARKAQEVLRRPAFVEYALADHRPPQIIAVYDREGVVRFADPPESEAKPFSLSREYRRFELIRLVAGKPAEVDPEGYRMAQTWVQNFAFSNLKKRRGKQAITIPGHEILEGIAGMRDTANRRDKLELLLKRSEDVETASEVKAILKGEELEEAPGTYDQFNPGKRYSRRELYPFLMPTNADKKGKARVYELLSHLVRTGRLPETDGEIRGKDLVVVLGTTRSSRGVKSAYLDRLKANARDPTAIDEIIKKVARASSAGLDQEGVDQPSEKFDPGKRYSRRELYPFLLSADADQRDRGRLYQMLHHIVQTGQIKEKKGKILGKALVVVLGTTRSIGGLREGYLSNLKGKAEDPSAIDEIIQKAAGSNGGDQEESLPANRAPERFDPAKRYSRTEIYGFLFPPDADGTIKNRIYVAVAYLIRKGRLAETKEGIEGKDLVVALGTIKTRHGVKTAYLARLRERAKDPTAIDDILQRATQTAGESRESSSATGGGVGQFDPEIRYTRQQLQAFLLPENADAAQRDHAYQMLYRLMEACHLQEIRGKITGKALVIALGTTQSRKGAKRLYLARLRERAPDPATIDSILGSVVVAPKRGSRQRESYQDPEGARKFDPGASYPRKDIYAFLFPQSADGPEKNRVYSLVSHLMNGRHLEEREGGIVGRDVVVALATTGTRHGVKTTYLARLKERAKDPAAIDEILQPYAAAPREEAEGSATPEVPLAPRERRYSPLQLVEAIGGNVNTWYRLAHEQEARAESKDGKGISGDVVAKHVAAGRFSPEVKAKAHALLGDEPESVLDEPGAIAYLREQGLSEVFPVLGEVPVVRRDGEFKYRIVDLLEAAHEKLDKQPSGG
ncbi:MAG: hypothetical protein V1735_05760 [Nanoarchaeota archaeon]